MKREILLKAYVMHQSEEAFRELLAASLDEVYSTAFRIVRGASHLAEEISLRVFLELARNAPRLREDIVLAEWLREHTCKTAVAVLREDGRSVDGPILKSEMQMTSSPNTVQEAAPPGLATRVCQGVLLNAARHKRFRRFSWPASPRWIRPKYLLPAAVCMLVIFVWRNGLFHRSNPIIRSESVELTPASFAQLAGSGDGEGSLNSNGVTEMNIQTNPKEQ